LSWEYRVNLTHMYH